MVVDGRVLGGTGNDLVNGGVGGIRLIDDEDDDGGFGASWFLISL